MLTTETTSLTINAHADLSSVCWTRFAKIVLEREVPHVEFADWQTSATTLADLSAPVLSTYRAEHHSAVLLDLETELGSPCLATVGLGRGVANVWVGAWSPDVVAAAFAWMCLHVPLDVPSEERRIPVWFWTQCGSGGSGTSRKIDVADWSAVSGNYPTQVVEQLDPLMARNTGPQRSGQLILWHGPPGTGKTSALRAMAWQWRSWCELNYVTDPDALFGGGAGYLMDVLLEEADEDVDTRWRLLVLEDTGELLSADAKQRTGQGLSRLLNVVDGIVGQGLRVLVLVTTNEPLGGLHPAVTRPGRCLACVEFPAFSADQASAWLAERGRDVSPGHELTLAELYAALGGEPVAALRRRPIGFTA